MWLTTVDESLAHCPATNWHFASTICPRNLSAAVVSVRPGDMVLARTRRTACGSLHAAPRKHVRDGTQEDLHVLPERPAGDVPVVDLHHLGQRHACRAEDLPVAGHARR